MPNKIVEKAYCKINLFLEVTGIRPDKYHELITVMQSVDLSDEIELSLLDGEIQLSCSDGNLPIDEKNLAWRAADLLKRASHIRSGVKIHLEKKVPTGAGLGGGSSDAAAVLRGCNTLWDIQYSPKKLEELGVQLGMDVPFCVQGGSALAINRGEKIKQHFPSPKLNLVLVYPNLLVSTKMVYEKLDEKPIENIRSAEKMIQAIQSGSAENIAGNLYNRLEEVTLPLYPEIGKLKEKLITLGCINAMMSGSGSAVFGICKNGEQAKEISEKIHSSKNYLSFALSTVSRL